MEESNSMSDYSGLGKDLGLNLESHAGLLAVLSEGYKNIYLPEKAAKGDGVFRF